MREVLAGVLVVVGTASTTSMVGAVLDSYAVPFALVLLVGPAWMLAFCLASSEDDFPDDARLGRDGWLRIIPWLFVLAPLVLPTMVLGAMFIRDSRADGGRYLFSVDRMRPGDHADHHWPE